MRGAWIEICTTSQGAALMPSLPVRGAWIEIAHDAPLVDGVRVSLPVRGAWIEISCCRFFRRRSRVAPRAGSVD